MICSIFKPSAPAYLKSTTKSLTNMDFEKCEGRKEI